MPGVQTLFCNAAFFRLQMTGALPDEGFMDVVIASGARTPVGSFNGAFANLPAHELGCVAI